MIDLDVAASRALKPRFYHAPYPENPNFIPKPYQLAGAEYCLVREHALLGDAPGVGKTAEAILVGNAIAAQRTLVIGPASLRLNWEREIWYWANIENVRTALINKATDGVSSSAHYVVTSYAMLANPKVLAALMMYRWDHLILDEAHAMKDPKGNTRTRAICGWSDGGTYHQGLADVSGRITMASGTILPNQPIECYNAIRLLDWSAINCASLNEFRNTYYELGEGFIRGPHRVVLDDGTSVMRNELYWSDEVRNVPTNLADLQFRLRKHIMVRRTKEMVLPQLPPKQWHLFPITTTAAMRKALKHPGWKKAEKLYEMDPGAFKTSMPIDGAISTARRELGEAKMPAMLDYIKQLLSEGVEKLVVSAWHHAVLDFLREKLAPYGLVYMDGTTNTAKKQAAVDAFQRDTQTKIILGQMLPLGQGWTLTAAQDAVFCEPDWVPGVNDQMLDRLQRIGQEGSYVLGHIPVVADSMDERILGRAIEKDKSIYAALDSE